MKNSKNLNKLSLNQETLRNLTNNDLTGKGLIRTIVSPCSGVRSVCFPVCTPVVGVN